MIDRRLSRAARPLRRLMRAGIDRADANTVRHVAEDIVGSTGTWVIRSVRRARSGTRIVLLENDQGALAFLKIADTAGGSAQLERENEMLTQLAMRIADADLRTLLPKPIDAGRRGRWAYLLQQALAGEPGTPLLSEPTSRRWLVQEAVGLAARIHDATVHEVQLTSREVDDWVDRPIELIGRLATPSAAVASRLQAIRGELRDALTGTALKRGFVHGDFWSENLLVDYGARRITGVVDWDSADPANLVAHDLLHLVLYTRKLVRKSEIGGEICRALDPDPQWEPEEQFAIRHVTSQTVPPGGTGRDEIRLPVLLYWLRLVSMNHARQPRVTSHRRWVTDNIDAVLTCV